MGRREEELRNSESWEQIILIEPRLEQLHRYANWIRDTGGPYFCANEIWGNLFKPQLVELVGWHREWHSDPVRDFSSIMKEGRTYDLVYRKIYDTLPSCRNCGCA